MNRCNISFAEAQVENCSELNFKYVDHPTVLMSAGPLCMQQECNVSQVSKYHYLPQSYHVHRISLIPNLWKWPGNESKVPYLPHTQHTPSLSIPCPAMLVSVNCGVFVVRFMVPSQQLHAAVQMARLPHLWLSLLHRSEAGSHISGPSSSVK